MSARFTSFEELLPDPLPQDPLRVAAQWLLEARERRDQPNPDAMVLATADANASPAARVVLCKGIVAPAGYLLFVSNYRSRKARDIEANPRGAAVFHWDHFHRQVRVEGPIVKAGGEQSDRYFATRAWQSRLGAWASQQSEPVATRAELQAAMSQTARRFGAPVPLPHEAPGENDPGLVIPRPPHWGSYCLWAESVELWVEGAARIHDRARWSRTLEALAGEDDGAQAFRPGPWAVVRLQP